MLITEVAGGRVRGAIFLLSLRNALGAVTDFMPYLEAIRRRGAAAFLISTIPCGEARLVFPNGAP